jgi:hypothetical protein
VVFRWPKAITPVVFGPGGPFEQGSRAAHAAGHRQPINQLKRRGRSIMRIGLKWNCAALTLAAGLALTGSVTAQPAVGGAAPAPAEGGLDIKKVYVLELKGHFGQEISQTPIRAAIADVKRHQPDYLIVIMDNDFSRMEGLDQIAEDEMGFFDQLFRAEDMDPIFTREIKMWDKPPEVVFWVKKAMGGAAFLPLISENIYFSSDAKMGGVGGVEKMMKGWGDEVVIQKQLSLRLKHAEGMAITGGHPPELINAMCLDSYVLSVSYDGDEPVFLERMPENNSEELLTDNGLEENADSDAAKARGEGDDVLTIDAEIARKLKLSKGTVATLDDLLFEMGLARNNEVVKGRSESILKQWADGISDYRRDLTSLWKDFEQIPVQGDTPRERNQQRGKKINRLEEMKRIVKKYEEAMNPRWFGLPAYQDLEIIISDIRTEMLRDK